MYKLFKLPLIFLFASACVGLFLRFQLIAPVPGIIYSNVLHAHSHVMFLGWVFNVLILAFVTQFSTPKYFKTLFWFLQVCVVGMLLSFPFQGYGPISITFSSLHTFGAIAFIAMFFQSTGRQSTVSLLYVRTALLFFALSSIGPFFLGYLKSNGLEHNALYRNSIYFYLHFQYNGFFLFGVLGLFVKLIEKELLPNDQRKLRRYAYIMIGSCVPAFLLSTLWSQPGVGFNIIGAIAGAMQLLAVILFLQTTIRFVQSGPFAAETRLLFSLAFASLLLKSLLQVMSAHPFLAAFANEFRSIVIAYLHLVLLGFISFFLIGWLIQKEIIHTHTRLPIGLVIVGFIISELILVISPWNTSYIIVQTSIANNIVLSCSIAMVSGFGLMVFTIRKTS